MGEGSIVFYYTLMYLLAILCPLVPAILIYRLFPNTTVSVGGPLAGLTLRAGGAFAAYVATFLLSMLIMVHYRDMLDSFVTPVWTVTGKVDLIDENGQPVTDEGLLNGISVEYFPNPSQTKFGELKLTVPINDSQWPTINVGVRDLGWLPLEYPFKDFNPTSRNHTIALGSPVTIKLNRSPYRPEGTNTDNSH
jgi:hypothetical protein